MAGQPRLFDDRTRDRRSPAKRSESQFAFLNSTGRPYFAPVRDLLEEWFAHWPDEARPGLRERFRKDDSGQHMGAFWELYLHEAHRRLGFDIEYEPAVPGTASRPDFLMRRKRERFYLEATLVTYSDSAIAARRRQDILLDLVDEVFDQDFYVRVIAAAPGSTTPGRAELIDPIERWLGQQNWAAARRAVQGRVWVAPTETFNARDGVVILEAHPKPDGLRGNRDMATIQAGPMKGGVFEESTPIYKDLKAKAKAYGQPDAPYVIAALCLREIASSDDVEAALYGKEIVKVPIRTDGGGPAGEPYVTRDFRGLWQRGQTPVYKRVSAVLSGMHIAPWSVAQSTLTLWVNPWADRPLAADDAPWKTVTGDLEANHLITREATSSPHKILGLPPEWPHPGSPFD